jgi:uncharacterized protein YrzB (UPF0473 family)
MPTIEINPRLWTHKAARLPDGTILKLGETAEVDDETFEELSEMKARQFSKMYVVYVEAGEVSEGEATTVDVENLGDLTVADLRAIVQDRGIATAARRKDDLVDVIREDVLGAADGDD